MSPGVEGAAPANPAASSLQPAQSRAFPPELLTLPRGPQARARLARSWPHPTTVKPRAPPPRRLARPREPEPQGGGAGRRLTTALVLPDKPPVLWSRGAHLPPPPLWLPPHALLGLPVSQAVLWGAHLPLEEERGQARLRDHGQQPAQRHRSAKVSPPPRRVLWR